MHLHQRCADRRWNIDTLYTKLSALASILVPVLFTDQFLAGWQELLLLLSIKGHVICFQRTWSLHRTDCATFLFIFFVVFLCFSFFMFVNATEDTIMRRILCFPSYSLKKSARAWFQFRSITDQICWEINTKTRKMKKKSIQEYKGFGKRLFSPTLPACFFLRELAVLWGLRRDSERHQVDQGTTHYTLWALEFTLGDKGATTPSVRWWEKKKSPWCSLVYKSHKSPNMKSQEMIEWIIPALY